EQGGFRVPCRTVSTDARRVALGMLRDEQTAKELVQEAILEAYLSLQGLRRPHQFRNWLYGITLNMCRSYLRDRKLTFLSLDAMLGGSRVENFQWGAALPDPQETMEAREIHRLVMDAVNALSPGNRSVTL